jgi:hypothetical protein
MNEEQHVAETTQGLPGEPARTVKGVSAFNHPCIYSGSLHKTFDALLRLTRKIGQFTHPASLIFASPSDR